MRCARCMYTAGMQILLSVNPQRSSASIGPITRKAYNVIVFGREIGSSTDVVILVRDTLSAAPIACNHGSCTQMYHTKVIIGVASPAAQSRTAPFDPTPSSYVIHLHPHQITLQLSDRIPEEVFSQCFVITSRASSSTRHPVRNNAAIR